MRWRPGWLICSTLVVLVLNGCGMTDGGPGGHDHGDYGHGTTDELNALMQRPDAEQVLADRDRMLGELAATLTTIVPGSRWQPDGDGDISPCAEFGSTYGKKYFSPLYISPTPVPAVLWDTAADAVVDIAERYGYITVTSRSTDPSEGDLTNLDINNDVGGYVTFGSQRQASFRATTGCYLTASAKQKAREAAPASG